MDRKLIAEELVRYHLEKTYSAIHSVNEASTIANHLAIFFLGKPAWLLWRTIRSVFDKDHRKCGTYDIYDERDMCIKRAKLKRTEKQIQMIEKHRKDCDEKRDPKKCREAGKTILKNLKSRRDDLKDQIKELEDED